MMKISLATNYENDLVEKIKSYPIYEIYGKLKNDIIGGGRPDDELKDIETIKFEQHVKKVRENGIKFNYLLNGSCLANNEQDEEWQEKFKEFLTYLKKIGVNALTITNPYVMQLVKKHFGNYFTLRVSTFACVDSFERAKYWEDMGADIICADFVKINRDFKKLKYMVENLKRAKIEILVTNSCIKNCPMIFTHTTSLSHASDKSLRKKDYEDWSLFYCQQIQNNNNEEYIKSPWVRPEDIKYYEDIGIEHFKITERGFPTEELVKRVKAYAERKYNGNLIDLIQGHGFLDENGERKLEKLQVNTRKEAYNEIKRVRGLGQPRIYPRHIYIDNSKLDGFIDFFVNDKCTNNCNACNYCKNISKQIITKNEEISEYLKELYNKYNEYKI
ncbi:MAG: U32 family peptidase [Clostridia bacterium]|nr:U32 family peptidase [Clostridia bacterium]